MADQQDKQLVRQIETQDLKKSENVVMGVKNSVITIGDDSWGKFGNESSYHKQSLRRIETQDLRKPGDVVIGFKDNVHHNKDITIGDDTWGKYAA